MEYPVSRQIFVGGELSSSTPQPPGSSPRRRPLADSAIHAVSTCCSASWFIIATCLLVLDLASDAYVVVVYALRRHVLFVGISTVVFIMGGFAVTVFYAVHMRGGNGRRIKAKLALCLMCNFPFQLGVVFHRIAFTCSRCVHTEPKARDPLDDTLDGITAARRPRAVAMSRANTEWVLIKLKLAHSLMQSAPQLILNVSHMLTYGNPHPVQYVSAGLSFASLLIGVVRFECRRKERLRGVAVGPLSTVCISSYKLFMLSARVLALASFSSHFGVWVGAILLPHFAVVFIYMVAVYGRVWKVSFAKIAVHAVGCMLDYVAVHNEYRPEGEVVVYYVLVLLENTIMVALPYAYRSSGGLQLQNSPWYIAAIIAVTVGSMIGLILMLVYYFALHRSRETIAERICDCCGRESSLPEAFPPRVRVQLFADPSANSIKSSLPPGADDEYYADDNDVSAPPSYTSCTHPSNRATPRPLANNNNVSSSRPESLENGLDTPDQPLSSNEERAPRPPLRHNSDDNVFSDDADSSRNFERRPLKYNT